MKSGHAMAAAVVLVVVALLGSHVVTSEAGRAMLTLGSEKTYTTPVTPSTPDSYTPTYSPPSYTPQSPPYVTPSPPAPVYNSPPADQSPPSPSYSPDVPVYSPPDSPVYQSPPTYSPSPVYQSPSVTYPPPSPVYQSPPVYTPGDQSPGWWILGGWNKFVPKLEKDDTLKLSQRTGSWSSEFYSSEIGA